MSHPFHQTALVAMGRPLLDNLDLDALAWTAERLRRWTFLFVAAPLPLKDATGSPLNPLAVFCTSTSWSPGRVVLAVLP